MDLKTFNSVKYGTVTVAIRRKSNGIWFHTPTIMTKEEAMFTQACCGYLPHGYSFYDYKTNENGTSWKCWLSCD